MENEEKISAKTGLKPEAIQLLILMCTVIMSQKSYEVLVKSTEIQISKKSVYDFLSW